MQNNEYGFLETHPQPRKEDLGAYYESEEYISHTDSKKGLMSFLYQSVKRYSLRKKVTLIKNQNGKVGSVLDVGAGTGEFLKSAKTKHWSVTGVEVNEKARRISKEKGITLVESLDEVLENTYDVVTLWHVLEHLPNIKQQLVNLEALVKPGGVLIIAVPNYNSFDAKRYKNYWAAYDVPRHLWHFSRSSMRSLFSSEMKLEKINPMIFDAFYVSLLSEKYKTGNSFSLKGIWTGLRSNLSALITKEYSSLIYCYHKTNKPE